MKLLLCTHCKDVIGLDYGWRDCACGLCGGRYHLDGPHAGDHVDVIGPCTVLGMQNGIRYGLIERGEVWIYDDKKKKVHHLAERPVLNS